MTDELKQWEYDRGYDRGYDKGYKQGKADGIKDAELFREIFLEKLLEDAFDIEVRENIIAICKESWVRFIAESEQMKKGAENDN